MIEGSKITKVRSMTDSEYEREYWPNNLVEANNLNTKNIG